MYLHDPQADSEAHASLVLGAQTVLRGQDSPVFGHLSDRAERRRLAAAMMLRAEDEGLDEGWWHAFRAGHGSRVRVGAPPTTCFCGVPVGRHRVIGAPEVSLAWHTYLWAPGGSDLVRKYRKQAAEAFPFLLQVTVTEAHSEDPRRSASAWEVLDGVDAGDPLVSLLRQYMRLSAAQVRASRDIPREAALLFRPADTARRTLGMLDGVADDLAFATARDWRHAQRWLPVIRVLQRRGQRGASVLYPPTDMLEEAVIRLTNSHGALERRALLRQVVRGLRAGSVTLVELARGQLLGSSRRLGTTIAQKRITLADGWTGRWLTSPRALRAEGREMKHCIGGYAQQVVRGEAAVLALSGPDSERATLLIEPVTEDLSAVHLQLAGVRNTPVPLGALLAAAESISSLYPKGVRVEL